MSNIPQGAHTPMSFNFDTTQVRVVMRDGQPWFVAADVCNTLGYKNTSDAITTHLDEDERYSQSLERGGSQVLINESGLYALVLRSRKPQARKFAKWVTAEVLPSIRKTGSYTQSPIPPSIDGQRLLVTFLPNGQVESKVLRPDVCVLSPTHLPNMLTLVREFVPNDILVEMMRYAFERLSRVAQR